jgi:hypothetical protein
MSAESLCVINCATEVMIPTSFQLSNINSVVLVRKRTIPTERPTPVGEVSASFTGLSIQEVAWSAQRIPTAVNLGYLHRNHYFLEIPSQLSSRG